MKRLLRQIASSRMTRVQISLVLLALCCALPVHSQNAEEVIQRYFQAIGGEQAWRNVTSLLVTGTLTDHQKAENIIATPSQRGPTRFRQSYERPDKTKMIFIDPDSLERIMCYNGSILWLKHGSAAPVALSKEQTDFFISHTMLGVGDLLIEESGNVIYKGQRTVDTVLCDVLEIKRLGWVVPYQYMFDSKTGLLLCTEATYSVQTRITFNRQYKRFGGMLFPTVLQSVLYDKVVSTTIYDSISVNCRLASDEFILSK